MGVINPYFITGPALISFSGGRTSAYMLRMVLDAHGGVLPDDVHVCFANTGKEREETLRFVHDCATHWGVTVRWLEWEMHEKGGRFREVSHNSAARSGEPFEALIKRKGFLPNTQMRYCTIELKIRVMRDFMKSLGHKRWNNAVGLRADEMHRVFKAIERNESGKERFKAIMPLAAARVRKSDVDSFWRAQSFDLGLKSYEGNCDLCFLKGRRKRVEIVREHPTLAGWWSRMEREAKCSVPSGARFDRFESVEQLLDATLAQPMFALTEPDDGEEFDAECGLWCAGDDHNNEPVEMAA
ncbi:MAG: hypothetical protein JWR85_3568 [Marmoricola sp.]|nr:hypothetical protein [Marmoricola sp.]